MQAVKLRFLQSVQELNLGDVAAELPVLLPGQAGQEALGAVSRQVRHRHYTEDQITSPHRLQCREPVRAAGPAFWWSSTLHGIL